MFAFVANGKTAICKTQRQLDILIALYPYPKFALCKTEGEALEWIRRNARGIHTTSISKYGNTSVWGYVNVEYFITEAGILYNIKTDKVGNIRIAKDDGIKIAIKGNLIKLKVTDTLLDDSLINHHLIAVQRILNLLGEYIDVNLELPDMSVYLALTYYKGSNYIIRNAQKLIEERLGAVSYSVKEYKLCVD